MKEVPEILKPEYYFDLNLVEYAGVFEGISFVWEAMRIMQDGKLVDSITRTRCASVAQGGVIPPTQLLGPVRTCIAKSAQVGPMVTISGEEGGLVCIDDGARLLPGTMISAGKNAVYVGKGVSVGPNAHVDAGGGSICIGEKAVLSTGAYVRGLSLVSAKAIIGNSCEIKCSLIGREAEAPHFNYVGDSILGYKTHMGAGVKISNLKITPDPKTKDTVKVKCDDDVFDTGLRKFGAIVGDRVRIGCNSVCNPGTLVGKHTVVYTGSNLIGIVPANTIMKLRQTFERVEIKKI